MSFRYFRSGFLLSVALLPTLFLAFALIHQHWIKWEMQEKLEKSQLTTLTLRTHSIQWAKKGKEILIDGKLFDVKSIVVENEQATIIGLFDEEETTLVTQINTQVHQHHTSHQLKLSLFSSILFGFGTEHTLDFQVHTWVAQSTYALPPQASYQSPLLAVLNPPPQG